MGACGQRSNVFLATDHHNAWCCSRIRSREKRKRLYIRDRESAGAPRCFANFSAPSEATLRNGSPVARDHSGVGSERLGEGNLPRHRDGIGSLIMTPGNVQSSQYVSEAFGTFDTQRSNGIILASMGIYAAFIIVLMRVVDRNLDFVMLASFLGAVLVAPVLVAAVRGVFSPLEAIYFVLPLFAYVYLVKPTIRLISEDQFIFGEQDLNWAMCVAIVG